ncbi:MAG: hypothetical protein WC979_00795 [Candidatus Pacearchaeota archaeon]|jgi:hypothetical protein|nr:hypothetical protein [Clostridia bacterium]
MQKSKTLDDQFKKGNFNAIMNVDTTTLDNPYSLINWMNHLIPNETITI